MCSILLNFSKMKNLSPLVFVSISWRCLRCHGEKDFSSLSKIFVFPRYVKSIKCLVNKIWTNHFLIEREDLVFYMFLQLINEQVVLFKRNENWKEKKRKKIVVNLNGLSAGDNWLIVVGLRWSSWFVEILCCFVLFNVVSDERWFDDLFVFFCKIVFELSPISFVLFKIIIEMK